MKFIAEILAMFAFWGVFYGIVFNEPHWILESLVVIGFTYIAVGRNEDRA